jgi:MarR family transcriptional regulator, organic hydroperoxide resistance regulator
MAKTKATSSFGQALTLAARRHRGRTAACLAELGLFPGQDQVLSSLGTVEALTMSEIATQLHIRPPTASKMIARMASQNLVDRRGKDDDARLVEVFITDAGRALLEKLARITKKIEKETLFGLDDKDERRLRRLLKKVTKNLGGKNAADSGDTDTGIED